MTQRADNPTPSDPMMALPDFIEKHGNEDDKRLAHEMLRVTRSTRVLLGDFFLYTAMTRSKQFADACAKSDASDGTRILVGALLKNMVVGVAALFDSDQRASTIPKCLNLALRPERSALIQRFHANYDTEATADLARERLVDYQRRLQRGKLKAAIKRLVHVRNTFVAHYDYEPAESPGGTRAIIHDFDRSIASAAVIVGEANFFILGRKVDAPELRRMLRAQARALTSTMERGFQKDDSSEKEHPG